MTCKRTGGTSFGNTDEVRAAQRRPSAPDLPDVPLIAVQPLDQATQLLWRIGTQAGHDAVECAEQRQHRGQVRPREPRPPPRPNERNRGKGTEPGECDERDLARRTPRRFEDRDPLSLPDGVLEDRTRLIGPEMVERGEQCAEAIERGWDGPCVDRIWVKWQGRHATAVWIEVGEQDRDPDFHRQPGPWSARSGAEIHDTARSRADDRPVAPGTAIFVPAGVEHHFHSITAELRVLVVFAPAETPTTP